jgi:hypothetical protein
MSGNPAEETRRHNKSELDRLQREANGFAARLAFTSPVEAVSDRERKLPGLATELKTQRARGYRYKGDLEARLADATARARTAATEVRSETERAASSFRARVDKLVHDAQRLGVVDAVAITPQLHALESEQKAIDQGLDAVESRIKTIAAPFTDAVDAVVAGVKAIDDIMDLFEQGKFKLEPGEDPFNCVAAAWEDAPGGPKNGLLLMTNRRIRFEHKDKVVTKKGFLFFGGETKDVQELLIDEPVGHLASSDDSTRGWVMKDQLLTFSWNRPAKVQKTTFKLASGYAKEWDDVVEALKAGTIETQRVAAGSAPAPADTTPERGWPSKCKECSGILPKPVKGQSRIACDYCGTQHEPL